MSEKEEGKIPSEDNWEGSQAAKRTAWLLDCANRRQAYMEELVNTRNPEDHFLVFLRYFLPLDFGESIDCNGFDDITALEVDGLTLEKPLSIFEEGELILLRRLEPEDFFDESDENSNNSGDIWLV
ncbi:MAG: hypothetical protein ABH837_01010 [bacterium]